MSLKANITMNNTETGTGISGTPVHVQQIRVKTRPGRVIAQPQKLRG